MRRKAMPTLTLTALAAALAMSSASAQQTVRVRGTIEKLDGNTLSVKSREGSDLQIVLTGNVQVVGVEKASLSDIKEGSYVGSAAMPQPDGRLALRRSSLLLYAKATRERIFLRI